MGQPVGVRIPPFAPTGRAGHPTGRRRGPRPGTFSDLSDTAVSPAVSPALPIHPSAGPPPPAAPPEADAIPGLDFRVEESTQTRRLVRAEIPAAVFEESLQVEFRKIRRKARISGFRRGKAPKALIEQRYFEEARDPACRALLLRATRVLLKELDLEPIATPSWMLRQTERGRPFVAEVVFDLFPALGTIVFEGIEVTVAKREVTEAEIVETLDEIARRQAKPGPLGDRGIGDADLVTGDLEETDLAGAEPPRATEEVRLQVGTGAYHPALHEALQGAAVGDTVVATAPFGADSPDPERAGKTFRVQFTVRGAATAVSPPIDDDLARSVGAASLLALRGDIRDRLREEAARADRREVEQKVMAAFLEKNPVEAPAPLVEGELQVRLQTLANTLTRQGVDLEGAGVDWQKHAEEMRPTVEGAVRASILLDALAEQEGLEPAAEQVEERLRAIADREKQTVAKVRAALDAERMKGLVAEIRREQALRFLEERAKIETSA